MDRTRKKEMRKRTGFSVIVAAGVLATGAGIASASDTFPSQDKATPSHSQLKLGSKRGSDKSQSSTTTTASSTDCSPRRRGCHGRHRHVDHDQERAGNSATYTIAPTTVVTEERMAGTVGDLAVGEHVRISLSPTDFATAVNVDIELDCEAGQVVSVTGDVIANRDGFCETIAVSGATTYSKCGASATFSDVTVGSIVFADGLVAADHTTLDASVVGIGQPATSTRGGARGHHDCGGRCARGFTNRRQLAELLGFRDPGGRDGRPGLCEESLQNFSTVNGLFFEFLLSCPPEGVLAQGERSRGKAGH